MIKITLELSEDELREHIIQDLKNQYLDQRKHWMHEKDAESFCDSLLDVLQYYMIHKDYEEWYETIKEL